MYNISKVVVYLYSDNNNEVIITKQIEIMTTQSTFIVVKFNFNNEITNWNNKSYTSKEDALNAGNSWTRDCTVNQNIIKGRWFEIKEIN